VVADQNNPFAAPEVDQTLAVGDGLDCPKCGAELVAMPKAQKCACGLTVLLLSGPAVDGVLVVPTSKPGRISLRAGAGTWSYAFGSLNEDSFKLDKRAPILSFMTLNSEEISFQEVGSICVWRRIDYRDVARSIFGFPFLWWLFALFQLLLMSKGVPSNEAVVFFLALLMFVFWLYQDLYIRKTTIRVTSKTTQLTFRFDKPLRRRLPFFKESLRRIGYNSTNIEIP